ncbi:DUF6493 family protein [Allostreptomyces psammosilenae]|uniref:HEAT repeat domain-containing protein n=1 Tax=Allostreptomyces psammosilenae TaxID=1892865 RepID=A0A852ZMM4_9ACTN|nr:DUF6493 family protein [Allostreptomyces psammosilenae]NYI03649.1 hypothetical protein [Allostreptomyces psammosilenae]
MNAFPILDRLRRRDPADRELDAAFDAVEAELARTVGDPGRDLLRAVRRGRCDRTLDCLERLPAQGRRAFAEQLKPLARALRARWWDNRPQADALLLAGLGCHGGAAAAARWIGRRDALAWRVDPEVLLCAIGERDAAWYADLATRVAALPTRPGESDYRLVRALARAAGRDSVPVGDAFVTRWVTTRLGRGRPLHVLHPDGTLGHPYGGPDALLRQAQRRRAAGRPPTTPPPPPTLLDDLRADPFLDACVDRFFDAPDVGAVLAADARQVAHEPERTWPGALRLLAEEGRLDRAALLDGCLARLLRGDTTAGLRGWLLLLTTLAPTAEEQAERAADYLRLLADAPTPVATHAQQVLLALDADGRLGSERLAEAAELMLFRPEKKLVRAGLTALDRAARRERPHGRTAPLLLAAATAFSHPDTDLQERAVNLIGRHLRHVDPAALPELTERLALAADAVSPAVRARAAEVLGDALPADPAAADHGAAALPPEPPAAAPVPPAPAPHGDLVELVQDIAVILAHMPAEHDYPLVERVYDGLVRHAHRDADALAEALAETARPFAALAEQLEARVPAAAVHLAPYYLSDPTSATRMLVMALSGAVRDATVLDHTGRHEEVPGGTDALHRAVVDRVVEIAVHARQRPVPQLLSAPTWSDGRISPTDLADRLEAFHRAGATPWPHDLDVALLRLDLADDGAAPAARRARRLPGEAARRVADWIEHGGLGPLVAVRSVQPPPTPAGPYHRPRRSTPRATVAVRATGMPPELGARYRAALADTSVRTRRYSSWTWALPQVMSLLPNHREALAGLLLESVAAQADEDWHGMSRGLATLAEASGPAGEATHLAVAYGLGARWPDDRTVAVDALLTLTARGALDPGRLAADLAELVALGAVKPNRLEEALAEAATAGATAAVWEVLRGLLPALLRLPEPPARGLPGMLATAVDCATRCAASGAIPEIDALAARPGGSRAVREARRLRDALARRPEAP